jgi:hypothetical protein
VLVAAAVCPHPPLLVPGVGAGASGELDGLRVACDAAVLDLLAAEPTLVVVVGGAPVVGPFGDGAWGSLAGFGVRVPVGSGPGEPTLPLSLTLGRWLVNRADGEARPLLFGVEPDAGTDRCLALGEALAGRADRVALLVMGDGSARRSVKGPGAWTRTPSRSTPESPTRWPPAIPTALAALDPARRDRPAGRRAGTVAGAGRRRRAALPGRAP